MEARRWRQLGAHLASCLDVEHQVEPQRTGEESCSRRRQCPHRSSVAAPDQATPAIVSRRCSVRSFLRCARPWPKSHRAGPPTMATAPARLQCTRRDFRCAAGRRRAPEDEVPMVCRGLGAPCSLHRAHGADDVGPGEVGPELRLMTASQPVESPGGPTWVRWRESPAVVLYRPHLRRTVAIALIVGTVLFCINRLDVVSAATGALWCG